MNSDRATAETKKANGKHIGKAKPSTKAHEVVREGYGIVFVGSRTACNAWWVRLDSKVRPLYRVQVSHGKW